VIWSTWGRDSAPAAVVIRLATTGGFTPPDRHFTGAVFEVTGAARALVRSATAGTGDQFVAPPRYRRQRSPRSRSTGYAPTTTRTTRSRWCTRCRHSLGPVHGNRNWETSDPSAELAANGAETDLGEPALQLLQFGSTAPASTSSLHDRQRRARRDSTALIRPAGNRPIASARGEHREQGATRTTAWWRSTGGRSARGRLALAAQRPPACR
jgi:hypothetical protein